MNVVVPPRVTRQVYGQISPPCVNFALALIEPIMSFRDGQKQQFPCNETMGVGVPLTKT